MFACDLQDFVELGAFTVEHIDHEEAGEMESLGGGPDFVGACFDAVGRIDHDHCGVGHAHGREWFADEIRGSRAVDEVDFPVEPIGGKDGCVDGLLVFFFVGVVIGCGVALGDGSDAGDFAGAS